jgi:hypothetical protein
LQFESVFQKKATSLIKKKFKTPVSGTLNVNDVIYAADFPVTITRVTSSNGATGVYSGEGVAAVPYLGSKVKVKFNNITVHTVGNDKRMIGGVIESTYDPTWGNILNLDGVIEGGNNVGVVRTGLAVADFSVSFPILNANAMSVVMDATGGASIRFPGCVGNLGQTINSGSLPTSIKDSEGRVYGVDKNGRAFYVGKQGTISMTSAELNTLSPDKGTVQFIGGGFYAFDAYHADYEKDVLWLAKYEKIGTYGVGHKASASGKPDFVKITMSLQSGFVPTNVKFITSKGMEYAANANANGTFDVQLLGGPGGDAQELYALYPKADGRYWSLGKLFIPSYEIQKRKLVLVPVNGAVFNSTAIADSINKIYNSVGIEWEVEQAADFTNRTWDQNGDNALDVGNTGLFTNLTDEMAALNKAYRTGRVLQNALYLFVLSNASRVGTAGDMPRGKQFGYIFTNTGIDLGTVAAHEIGHGYFKLKHTFDRSYSFAQNHLANNLMNYNQGTFISKYQWDILHDVGMAIGLFDDDEDGKYETDGHYSTVYLVGLIIGLGEALSYELAKYAEWPDTHIHDEIHFEMDDTWLYRDAQLYTHSLTHGFHNQEELLTALAFLYTDKANKKELGRILHCYGDTYAHTNLNAVLDWSTADDVDVLPSLEPWLKYIDTLVVSPTSVPRIGTIHERAGICALDFLTDTDIQRHFLSGKTLYEYLGVYPYPMAKYRMYGKKMLGFLPYTGEHFATHKKLPDLIYMRPKWYLTYVKNLAAIIAYKYNKPNEAINLTIFNRMTAFAQRERCSLKGIIDYEISKKLPQPQSNYVMIPVFTAAFGAVGAIVDEVLLSNYLAIAGDIKDKTIQYIREIDNKEILRVETIKENINYYNGDAPRTTQRIAAYKLILRE